MKQCLILGPGELGRADFTASGLYGPTILGVGELAGEPTHTIFSIKHFRDIIHHAVVLGADRLDSHSYVFLLHGIRCKYIHEPR